MGLLEGILFCDRCGGTIALDAPAHQTPSGLVCSDCLASSPPGFRIEQWCPQCAQALSFGQWQAGRQEPCPRCRHPLRVELQLPCGQCGARLKAPAAAAGHRVRCAVCGHKSNVPGLIDASPKPARWIPPAAGEIRPREIPPPPPPQTSAELQCPRCSHLVKVKARQAGQIIACGYCKEQLRVWQTDAGQLRVFLRSNESLRLKRPAQAEHGTRASDVDEAPIWHFFANVVGVSYPNADGSDRQEIIARCTPLEQLDLVPDPHNPHDPNAIRVCRQNGEQIGHLARGLAAKTTERLADGYGYTAWVMNILGRDGPAFEAADEDEFDDDGECPLGMNILILVVSPEVTDAEAQEYLDRITPMMRREAD